VEKFAWAPALTVIKWAQTELKAFLENVENKKVLTAF